MRYSTTLLLIGVLGCMTMAQPVARLPFPEAEYTALAKSGTCVVRGQAFLKTRGGDVKTAAGNEVLLVPVTSYSQQWYSVTYMGGRPLTAPDARYEQYVHRTTADGDGRFTFSNVAPGAYYVVARVTWERPSGYRYVGLVTEGGFVVKEVTVREGEPLEVIVTR